MVEFNNITIRPPWEKDKWPMREFIQLGYSPQDLISLNQVRLHQQVLFLSDILGASGKDLDVKYLSKRPNDQKWSTLGFAKEKPPAKDFRIWEQALQQLVLPGGIQDRMGPYKVSGHKIWNWRIDRISGRLLHIRGENIDIY